METNWDIINKYSSGLVISACDGLHRTGKVLMSVQQDTPVLVRCKQFRIAGDVYWPDASRAVVDYTRCQDSRGEGRLTLDAFDMVNELCSTPREYMVVVRNIEAATKWANERIAGLKRAQEHILKDQGRFVDEVEARVGLGVLEDM